MIVNKNSGLKPARINITTLVNKKNIRKETRNGREVIIVPSATLPDNIVMNDIMYPADEIAKSYHTLDRTPAPLGHPMVNGQFVSALDPEGLNAGWIGAWNENVRREGGRVFLDKVIDVARANESEGGRRVLEAINKGEPIHTSTGLLAHLEPIKKANYKYVAHDIDFDHDAILLDVAGAATPEDGVGIFVNSDGERQEVQVVNSIYEQTENDLDWAVEQVARALERRQKASLFERMKSVLVEAFGGDSAVSETNEKDEKMTKEELESLTGKIDKMSEDISKIGEAVGTAVANAIKPIVDAHNAQIEAAKAAEETEKAELVDKVVKANLLEESAAKETPLATLKALAANIKKPDETGAPRLANGFGKSAAANVSAFKPPKAS